MTEKERWEQWLQEDWENCVVSAKIMTVWILLLLLLLIKYIQYAYIPNDSGNTDTDKNITSKGKNTMSEKIKSENAKDNLWISNGQKQKETNTIHSESLGLVISSKIGAYCQDIVKFRGIHCHGA